MLLTNEQEILRATISASSGTLEVVSAATAAGKKVRIIAVVLSLGTAGTLQFKSNTTALGGAMQLAAGQPLVLPLLTALQQVYPWYVSTVGEALNLATTQAVAGEILYTLQP